MPLFTPENADLLAGQTQGYQMLEANTRTQTRDVQRLMDRYGTANADYLQKMKDAQLGAEGEAKLRLDAKLQDSQLRARIHEYKLKMLRDAYKQQAKDERTAMWTTALGSAASMAPGVYGLMAPTPQTSMWSDPSYIMG